MQEYKKVINNKKIIVFFNKYQIYTQFSISKFQLPLIRDINPLIMIIKL